MCVNGACKFMADFAFECPVKVFLELMGRPQERTREFMAWEHKLLHEHDLQEVIKGTRAVVDYLREQIEDRKKNPRDELIYYGIESQKDGRSLSENELLGFGFNLFIGGLDTVATKMARQVWHLARNPDDKRKGSEKREMIAGGI